MTEGKPKPPLPMTVFQQLRDRPQFSAECWLARRIFRHYGLGTAVRKRIRFELMKERPANERDEWNAALLILFVVHRRAGRNPPEYCALRETERTDEVRAEKWFLEVILPTGDEPPHLLVRTKGDQAVAIWSCLSDRNLGSIEPPYTVKAVSSPGQVMVVQDLDAYLGPVDPVARDRMLTYLFEGSRDGVPPSVDSGQESVEDRSIDGDEPAPEDANYE